MDIRRGGLRNFLPLRWMSRDPVSAFIVFMPRVS